MSAASAKPLFRATRHTRPDDLHSARRTDDFYPTPPAPTKALLAYDGGRIRELGAVWEPAVGDGAIARVIDAAGLPCLGSDLVDRGWPGVVIKSFYEFDTSPAPAIITNPPYCEINARDGHGRWLRHTLDMPGWDYCALLLNWDWPAAKKNGLAELLARHPFSWCYLMRWKIDFTGAGAPPQRNAWFVWDRTHTGPSEFRFMDRIEDRQEVLI